MGSANQHPCLRFEYGNEQHGATAVWLELSSRTRCGWCGTVVAPLKLYHDMVCYHGIVLSCVVPKPASLVLWGSLSYWYLIRSPFLLIRPRGSSLVANKKPVRHIHLVGLSRRKSYFDRIIQKCHVFTFPACHEARGKACELHSAYQRHPAQTLQQEVARGIGTENDFGGQFRSISSVQGPHPEAGVQALWPSALSSSVLTSLVLQCGFGIGPHCSFSKPRSPSSQRASLMCCH